MSPYWTQLLIAGLSAVAGALIREIVGDAYRSVKRAWSTWKGDLMLLAGFGLMIYLTELPDPLIPDKLRGLAWVGFLSLFLLTRALGSYFHCISTMPRPPRN